jgi:UDP-2,3-diacylglucosamine pyrophosphatase LpxH
MKSAGSIIVVADTHFGIKKGYLSMPGYFGDFLMYFKNSLKENPLEIFDGEIRGKILQEPEKLILLGDIVELWDSEDEVVNLCIPSLISTLSEIKAKKIYVLGNHDNILEKAVLNEGLGYYSLGKSTFEITENTYPLDGFLKVGDRNYLFIHGHQFSPGILFGMALAIDKLAYWLFSWEIKSYSVIPSIRKIKNSMGSFFSWIFILFLLAAILPYMLDMANSLLSIFGRKLGYWIFNYRIDTSVVLILLLFGIPKLIIDYARSLYNRCAELRYKRQKTISSFTKWWKGFRRGKNLPPNMNVIYGHTHFLNYISPSGEQPSRRDELDFYLMKLKEKRIERRIPTLINISSWVKDMKNGGEGEYKNVMVASFLYIDEEGPEFFGWDWRSKRIFHIPKEAIIERREKGFISKETKEILEKIRWPEKLIQKWMIPFALE